MRGKREKYSNENLILAGIVAVAILIVGVVGYFIYHNIVNKIEEQGIIEDVGEAEDEEEYESASTQIGKSVEEMQNQTENINKEENVNNTSKNTTNTTNSTTNKNNTTTKTNTTKQNTSVTKSAENTVANTNKEEKHTEQKEEKIEFSAPVKGEVIKEFAKESLVFSETLQEWVTHNGVDIKADKTSVVTACAKGTVYAIKNDPRYGLTVIINHDNGYQSVYSNLLTSEFVVEGETVEKGQTIGTVGNTASFEISDESHLHFEILQNNEYLDPTIYMQFE